MPDTISNERKFSDILSEVYLEIPAEGASLEEFLDILGDQGLFMTCMILTAPFLLPVSIPGSSIPFGTVIFLLSLRIIFNRNILIPKRFMDYRISRNELKSILKEISHILTPLEKVIKPRLCFLSSRRRICRFNGAMIGFGAILLVTPIIAPLGDFIPSYGILFISLGTLEHDGYMVLGGYATVIGTAIYYALIFAVGLALIIYLASYILHLI